VRFFYDTEFFEDGPQKPIHLISIGIVAEDGRELYLENNDFDPDIVPAGHFLVDNVFPWLYNQPDVLLHHEQIRDEVRKFLVEDSPQESHELWGYYSDYDHVILAQLFGRMVDMPDELPWYTLDLKQVLHMNRDYINDQLDVNPIPAQDGVEHHALSDARWNKKVYDWLEDME